MKTLIDLILCILFTPVVLAFQAWIDSGDTSDHD